ncbi:hypothetical protein E5K00_12330 [Hymenobacter aquaticus]|uniref:Uncharacterized protein n=1 Tax=Hymenobacter aquaticus TaxID=1867101 RepID=A0A4Z0Q979_9BACT|nr:hypothetical protein [Hymenobacter aquaticus]TGE25939.1 hypothetical protein E5K00_12330 [Hymenobacter aquaticus]
MKLLFTLLATTAAIMTCTAQTSIFPKTKQTNINNIGVIQNFGRKTEVNQSENIVDNPRTENIITKIDLSNIPVLERANDIYKNKRNTVTDSINTIDQKIKSSTSIIDLNKLKTRRDDKINKLSIIEDSITILESTIYAIQISRGNLPWFLPVGKSYEARVLAEYNLTKAKSSISALNNFALIGNVNNGSLYTELVGGYFGIFRIGLSTLLATSKDTARNKEAIQRFVGGGGNSVLELTYPAIFYKSKYFETQTLLSIKASADIPAFGTKTDQFAGNLNPAFDVYFALTTDEREFKFFSNTRIGPVVGFKDFYTNLNISKKAFLYAQTNVGVIISENLSVSLTIPIISTQRELLYTPVRLSTQIIPNKTR